MSLGQVYSNLNVIRVRRGHPARYKSFFKKNPLIVKSAQPLKKLKWLFYKDIEDH